MTDTIVYYGNGNGYVKLYATVLKTAKAINGPFYTTEILNSIIQQGGKKYKGGKAINAKAIERYLYMFSCPEDQDPPLKRLAPHLYECRR